MKALMETRLQEAIDSGNFLLFEHKLAIHLLLGDVYYRDLE